VKSVSSEGVLARRSHASASQIRQAFIFRELMYLDFMAWVLDVYWDLRPCAETQALYKSKGLRAFEYWSF
jgi:hypothetical protein